MFVINIEIISKDFAKYDQKWKWKTAILAQNCVYGQCEKSWNADQACIMASFEYFIVLS